MRYALRLPGGQHAQLQRHLLPGEGLEAAGFILCGRVNGADRHAFCARRVVPIPHKDCKRTAVSVDWPTKAADELIAEAMKRKMAIVRSTAIPAPGNITALACGRPSSSNVQTD